MLKILTIIIFCCAKIVAPDGRVIGGEPAYIESIPYQLSLTHNEHHFCGAALISLEWALTAAHCLLVYPINELAVRVNSSWRHKDGELIKVLAEYVHRHYNAGKHDYDIGALKLDKSKNPQLLKFAELAKCNKIPWPGKSLPKNSHLLIRISGWGFNGITDQIEKDRLQKVTLYLFNNDICYHQLKGPPIEFDVSARMMCANYGKKDDTPKDACKGDSGGPVTYNNKLIGIVSTGFGCAEPDIPGIYTNLTDSSISLWIKKITNLSNCDEYIE